MVIGVSVLEARQRGNEVTKQPSFSGRSPSVKICFSGDNEVWYGDVSTEAIYDLLCPGSIVALVDKVSSKNCQFPSNLTRFN